MDYLFAVILSIIVLLSLAAAIYGFSQKRRTDKLLADLKLEINTLQIRNENLLTEKQDINQKYEALQNEHVDTIAELAAQNETLKYLQKEIASKNEDLLNVQKQLRDEFKNLSNEILKQSTESLTDSNQKSMNAMIQPLKEKIDQYSQLINRFRESDVKERSVLSTEIKQLHQLNEQLSKDAQNLAGALKADTKMQGNWGEVILDRVLEKSGLEVNITYKKQFSTQSGEHRIQPDVVVFLPEGRHLIIDSKVSLKAFEKYVNSESAKEQEEALSSHINSIKTHIKTLAAKRYDEGEGMNTPDFIFLFMPMENALSLAIQNDDAVQNLAWEHHIVLVTPSTLMATLMTVANLWKIDKQYRFAETIAEETGKLYDKFVNFLESVNDVGSKLEGARKSHEQMVKQLSEGKGNLVSRAEKIKDMGIAHKKSLPSNFKKLTDND
ncbi:MAG: DNA recombination protein RmuC [Salinivirgaceae bacterium]|nr:MAG: DNA recombination protein RmuC [Salinivirgaceae bacterium]